MIRTISSGPGINVHGGDISYPYVDMSTASAGMIRYNGGRQSLEVYDGHTWLPISGNHTVLHLDDDTRSLLEWARHKRSEDQHLNDLIQKHPSLKDAHDKFKILLALIRTDKTLELDSQ